MQGNEHNRPHGAGTPLIEGGKHRPANELSPTFDPDVLPDDASTYLTIERDLDGEGYIAVTSNHVGRIPCETGTTLTVQPKAEIRDLQYFLRKSGRLLTDVNDPFNGGGHVRAVRDLAGIEEIFARNLLASVDAIASRGPLKRTTRETITDKQVSGSIDKTEYAKNVLKGRPDEIPQTVTRDTADNAENRFLKAVLRYMTERQYDGITDKDVDRCLRTFEGVNEVELDPELVESIRTTLATDAIPASRSYYRAALQNALSLIENAGVSLSDGVPMPNAQKSFMIPTPDVFEDYVRNAIEDLLGKTRYNVYDGNKRRQRTLYTAQSPRQRELRPDIVVTRDDEPIAVIDAKYTSNPNEEDDYKTFTYKKQYGVEVAAHVALPHQSIAASSIETKPIEGEDGSIDLIRLWLGDFDAAEKRLAEYLRTNLPHAPPSLG